jgi:hypothetical protein
MEQGALFAKHSLVPDNAASFLAFFNSTATIADLNCEGVVIHKAGDGDRKLDHLFRFLFMTICASQQFSVLKTKTKTASTVIHKAKYEDWQLDHLFRSLSMTIGASQQFSVLNTKIRTTSTVSTKPDMRTGSLTTSSGFSL